MSTTTLGHAFAEALAEKDFDRVRAVLDPEVDFRALTPRRAWDAAGGEAVVREVLRVWFGDSDHLERLVSVETDSVADRQRVSYRMEGHNDDGEFVIEQQAYYTETAGRIDWMRVLCSGFRPR
jgi:hypothetical protein